MTDPKPIAQECNCTAYSVPHPAGVGECHVEDVNKPICESCSRNCESTTIDNGIGPYEYWGQKGVDTDIVTVSDCCEASFIEPPTLSRPTPRGSLPTIDYVLPRLSLEVAKELPEDHLDLLKRYRIPHAAIGVPAHPYWQTPECFALYRELLELLCGWDLEALLNGND